MKKLFKSKSKKISEPIDEVSPQVKTDLAGLVNKMYEQLVALEKKVDILINRPAERAHDGGNRFQKHGGSRFGHPDRFGGGRRDERSGGGKFGDRPREKRFNEAICSECGKKCELPFKPTGDRPVYCRECFAARNDSGSFKGNFDHKPREENFSRERNFDNRDERKGPKFGKKKGPFFQR
jgi:CxxC-x17-CxxC domain-containing protein